MNKKRLFSFCCSLALIPSILGSNTTAVPASAEVGLNEVSAVAQFYIDRFSQSILPEWSVAEAGDPIPYFWTDHTKVAYEFTVFSGEKEVGFIIISTKRTWCPVLEWGNGKSPSSYMPFIIQKTLDQGIVTSRDVESPEILYWGTLSYSTQLGDTMKHDGTSIHLPTGKITRIPNKLPTYSNVTQRIAIVWDSIAAYQRIEDSLDAETNEISGVPAWFQSSSPHASCDEYGELASYPSCVGSGDDPWDNWDGCAPIAGAMVLGYWDQHGYSNFSGDDETMIDQCHWEMDTTNAGATDVNDIDDGIDAVSQLYSYDFSSSIISDTWGNIVDEVDAGRPFVLSFLDHPTYGDHAVCGWGYYVDDFVQSIGTHDTWDTSDHWLGFLDWDDAWITKVIPGT